MCRPTAADGFTRTTRDGCTSSANGCAGDTLWTARAGEAREFDVKVGPFDAVMLQEEIAKGQRVERFRIEISDDGRTWETAAEGTTIGYKRIVRLPEARTARKLRVTIDGTRAPARISHVGLYLTE